MTHLFDNAPSYMPALLTFMGIAIALISFTIGVFISNRSMEAGYFRVLRDLGIAVAGGKVLIVDANRFISHPKIEAAVMARLQTARESMR